MEQENLASVDKRTFKNTIVTNVKLKNGLETEMVTIFNGSEINFEEVSMGIRKGLERTHNVSSFQSTFYYMTTKGLDPICYEQEIIINY